MWKYNVDIFSNKISKSTYRSRTESKTYCIKFFIFPAFRHMAFITICTKYHLLETTILYNSYNDITGFLIKRRETIHGWNTNLYPLKKRLFYTHLHLYI